MTIILNGRNLAQRLLETLSRTPTPSKTLVGILVGGNPASINFLGQKERTAHHLGVKFVLHRYENTITQTSLTQHVAALDADPEVGGIIVQLPLPASIDRAAILKCVSAGKDVDGLNRPSKTLSPTVATLATLLTHINFKLNGKTAAVVGKGFLIGQPVAHWLTGKAKKVVLLGRGTITQQNLKKADLVVSGVGSPGIITGNAIKQGAVLIDFGCSFRKGKIQGDIDVERCKEKASFITPTPGGTGPLVVAHLFKNFYELNA